MKRRDVVVWLAVLALVVSLAAMMRTVRADGEGDPANTGETWTLNVSNADRIDEELAKASSGAKIVIRAECYEVMDVPDRILVMYEGEIVGELDPKQTTQEELGLYMAGAKRDEVRNG